MIVVSNTSKVLKRKQITTIIAQSAIEKSCFQYIKGTKKKANHNSLFEMDTHPQVVSNTSKVLKRKQITTMTIIQQPAPQLFPIHQRY